MTVTSFGRGALVVLVLAALALAVTSAADRLAEGNDLFSAGSFDQARDAYQEALVDLPDSAIVYYNLGNVAHELGEHDEAETYFQDALRSLRGEAGLERKVLYNLGNTLFRRGMETAEAEPEQALEILENAAGYYLEVIEKQRDAESRSGERADDDLDAAYNLEVVRIRIKEILDRLNQEEEETPEEPPDPVKMLLEWIDAERDVVKSLERHVGGEGTPEELGALLDTMLASQTANVEKADEIVVELERKLEETKQAAAQAPPGMTPVPGGMGPGGAGSQGPPPELFEAAIESVRAAKALQEESRTKLDEGDTAAAQFPAERSLDPAIEALGAIEPMRGLERLALVGLETQEHVLRGLGASDSETTPARQAGNIQRTARLQGKVQAAITQLEPALAAAKEAEAAAAAQPGAPTPVEDPDLKDLPSPLERMVAAMKRVDGEVVQAGTLETQALESLSADATSEAITQANDAAGHLREAHAELEDLLKNWQQVLADAVKAQSEVIVDSSVARALLAQADADEVAEEAKQSLDGALAKQTDNLVTTLRALEGAVEQQAQAAAMGGGMPGAMPGGAPPGPPGSPNPAAGAASPGAPAEGPDYAKVEQLIREGLAAERDALERLEASAPEEAMEPATVAYQKLREALELLNENQDQGNGEGEQEQPQDQEGDQDENDEDEQDPNEEEPPQDEQPPEDENQDEDKESQPTPPPGEEETPPTSPQMLTPQEAMRRLLEMAQQQEKNRQELERRYGVRRKGKLPVEKDW